MEILDKNYSQREYRRYDLGDKLILQYSYDAFKRAVSEGVIRDYIAVTGWKEHIKEKYRVSETQLSKAIKEVKEFIKRSDYSIDQDDVVTLKAYRAKREKWVFEICSLSGFEWYNKYFKNIINKTGMYSIVSHNGILCGNVSFFFRNSSGNNLATIVLLKDKYRPHLDVARDGVRGLTLETASEIEIIKRNISNQGFAIDSDFSKLSEENYSYIVMNDFCRLLMMREDLAKQLVFKTSEGLLSNEDLSNELI